MGETLEYVKKAETLQREKDNDSHYACVGKTLARTNPKEYKRISQGKPKTIGAFFDSVLSMFTPDVTMRIPRLQQIERESKKNAKSKKNSTITTIIRNKGIFSARSQKELDSGRKDRYNMYQYDFIFSEDKLNGTERRYASTQDAQEV